MRPAELLIDQNSRVIENIEDEDANLRARVEEMRPHTEAAGPPLGIATHLAAASRRPRVVAP